MDETGAKRLAAAIIKTTYDDLVDLYKRVMHIRNLCKKRKLYQYIYKNEELKFKIRTPKNLPFDSDFDYTAVTFFGSEWGIFLTNSIGFGLDGLPTDLKNMIEMVQGYQRYCIKCVQEQERVAKRAVRDRAKKIL